MNNIFEAYQVVTSVINNTEITQSDIDTVFISTFLQALAFCDVDSFANIYQLLLIVFPSPITSAEAERSFSLLRRIKIPQ